MIANEKRVEKELATIAPPVLPTPAQIFFEGVNCGS